MLSERAICISPRCHQRVHARTPTTLVVSSDWRVIACRLLCSKTQSVFAIPAGPALESLIFTSCRPHKLVDFFGVVAGGRRA